MSSPKPIEIADPVPSGSSGAREIKFIDELPKTGTGKIDRQALLRV